MNETMYVVIAEADELVMIGPAPLAKAMEEAKTLARENGVVYGIYKILQTHRVRPPITPVVEEMPQ